MLAWLVLWDVKAPCIYLLSSPGNAKALWAAVKYGQAPTCEGTAWRDAWTWVDITHCAQLHDSGRLSGECSVFCEWCTGCGGWCWAMTVWAGGSRDLLGFVWLIVVGLPDGGRSPSAGLLWEAWPAAATETGGAAWEEGSGMCRDGILGKEVDVGISGIPVIEIENPNDCNASTWNPHDFKATCH